MASKVEIQYISAGFEQILCSGGTFGVVSGAAAGIAARANANNARGGSGFHTATRIGHAYGSNRVLGFVYTTDAKSRLAEAEDKALSSAV